MSAKKSNKVSGLLAKLLADPQITEVMIDGTQRVTFEKRGKIADAGFCFKTDRQVMALIESALKAAGAELEEGKTVYDVRLKDNSRMVVVLPPTAVEGPCVTFRKWMINQLTWEKLLEYNAVSAEMRDLFQSAINARAGILIAGGTGSGKTTVANRVAELISPDERVVVVEDARQYQIQHPRAIFLEAKGTPDMTMNAVISAGAKMRPDWLVIGELEGAEAMRAMEVFSAGYSGLTVMHATGIENALTRLETMCLMANLGIGLDDIRQIVAAGLKLIAYQEKLPNGKRKVMQVSELKGLEDGRYVLQPLMRYDPETDQFESTGAKPGWVK